MGRRSLGGAAVGSIGTGAGTAVTGVDGGDSNPVGSDTDSGSFNEAMNGRFVRRILRLGRQSVLNWGVPIGNQLSSSIVGWFCRK